VVTFGRGKVLHLLFFDEFLAFFCPCASAACQVAIVTLDSSAAVALPISPILFLDFDGYCMKFGGVGPMPPNKILCVFPHLYG
jgi:hypothetical protein